MAKRTASAKKQARSGVKRALRNRSARSEVKTRVVKARTALAEGAETAKTVSLEAIRSLDRAASKGVIHRNNAARRKARLMKRMAVAASAPAVEARAAKAQKAAPRAAKKPVAAKAPKAEKVEKAPKAEKASKPAPEKAAKK